MVKKLLSFIVVCLFAVSANAYKNHAQFLSEVVRPLQFSVYNPHTNVEVVGDHCTAFSVQPKFHGWATAAHCVFDAETGQLRAEPNKFYIAGHDAELVRVDLDGDIALLKVTDGWGVEKGIKLAKHAPKPGDFIETMGYPFVWGKQFYFAGFVAATEFASFPSSAEPWFGSFAGLIVIGGQSGSPIIDKDGRLVGLLSIGFGEGMGGNASPVTGFTSFENLKAFDEGWVFEK